MAKIKYTRTINTTLKTVGELDVDTMTIYIDDKPRTLKSLLRDFNVAEIELSVRWQV